jgi:hypothetical protein
MALRASFSRAFRGLALCTARRKSCALLALTPSFSTPRLPGRLPFTSTLGQLIPPVPSGVNTAPSQRPDESCVTCCKLLIRENETDLSCRYTAAFALLEALWEVSCSAVLTDHLRAYCSFQGGVTTCFVNIGSDHPSIVEAIVRGKRERPNSWPRIITCPSEMTAISMADGYARVSGRPQAVFVHVDVGTQALGHGVHNASIGRVPVFIFAGLCPYDESGELPGSRNEYQHWLQEAPDQKAIVRQYCRHVGEIRTGMRHPESLIP